MSRHQNRIDEEVVCIDALKHVLQARCKCKDVRIQRHDDDPPDFTMTIDAEQFPVEVTSIVSQQQYHAQCGEFTEAVRQQAAKLHVLCGCYSLSVTRLPRIPKAISPEGKELIGAAISFIRSTNQQHEYVKKCLARDECGEIDIEKVSPTGCDVQNTWTPEPMRGGEVRTELTTLIDRAIKEKKSKLARAELGENTVILALYDAFGFGGPSDAGAAFRQASGYEWFHSVFWAASFTTRPNSTDPSEPGRHGMFLYSARPEWNGVGTCQ